MKKSLTLIFCFFSFLIFAQIDSVKRDSLINKVKELIGDDWYVRKTQNGFSVTFCRSCNNNYKKAIEEGRKDVLRDRFLGNQKIDSVYYFSMVSSRGVSRNPSKKQYNDRRREWSKANGIIKIDVIFETKWESQKYDSIYSLNETLKKQSLNNLKPKSSTDIFLDYRSFVPTKEYFRNPDLLGNSFQKLPYNSLILPNSLFLNSDFYCYGCEAVWIDKSDNRFFLRKENYLKKERNRTLQIIALVLGIHDFKIID